VFSAQGLREGVIFDALPDDRRDEDPLTAAAADLGRRFGRFELMPPAMIAWTAPLFEAETPAETRLRATACHLGDIGWSHHPDYRARQMFDRVLTLPLAGLEHHDRGFLAYTINARYAGESVGKVDRIAGETGLSEADLARARALGQALRLGFTISAGRADLLARTRFRIKDGALLLDLPNLGASFTGDTVQRRLNDLANTLGLKPQIVLER
jgi:exopolyphosphatase/guanosine-5'-triphosphate,3'-diphosphate pyrophosphatase